MIPIVATGPWKKHTKHTQCTYVCEYKLATENGEASYYIKKNKVTTSTTTLAVSSL